MLADAFPVLIVSMKEPGEEERRYIVDAINTPAFVLNCSSPDETEEVSRLSNADKKSLIQEEIDLLEEFSKEEFYETLFVRTKSSHILEQHPQIRKNITEILNKHGLKMAQERRRADTALTMGVSVEKIAHYLETNYGLSISPTSVRAFFTEYKGTDRVLVQDVYIENQKIKTQNSQRLQQHCRATYLAKRNRDLLELAMDLAITKGERVCVLWADDKSKTPLVVYATTHVFANQKRRVAFNDQRDWFDHNFTIANQLAMEITGIAWTVLSPSSSTLYANTIEDKEGRTRLPRPKVTGCSMFLRGQRETTAVEQLQQVRHWDDYHVAIADAMRHHEVS